MTRPIVLDLGIVWRFWDKVEKTDTCWLWTGVKNHDGYGRLKVDGQMVTAHRIAYLIAVPDFDQRMLVLHRCDNPSCVRADHLFLGTVQTNMADKAIKGRAPRGENHHGHKVTDDEVEEIRQLYKSGLSQRAVALRFGISHVQVGNIVNNIHRTRPHDH